MVIRHSDSLILVWRLAELEARNLGDGRLAPCHFFLGLLKAVDVDVEGLLSKAAGAEADDIVEEISLEVGQVRRAFDLAGLHATPLRRGFRRSLRPPKDGEPAVEGRMRRSGESKEVFARAENLAGAADGLVRPIHLFLAILQEGPRDILAFLGEAGIDPEALRRSVNEVLIQGMGDKRVADRRRERRRKGPVRRGGDLRALEIFGRDLCALARHGKLPPIIGRRDEMRRLAQIMAQSRKNNVILIGDAGVGKTGIVEGLAQRIVAGDVIDDFRSIRIVELSLAALVAGTTFRGDFEARLQTVLKEASADPDLILFLDEIHLIMGVGQGAGGAMDAANILKPALARGEVRVIGATTTAEYRRHIEKDAAIERRFQVIDVEEPTREETLEILKGVRSQIEKHHRLQVADEALEAAIDLSVRYLSDLRLPDKAIDLIDQACAQVRMVSLSPREFAEAGEGVRIDRPAIARVVAKRCRVPVESVDEPEGKRLLELEVSLRKRVKGQDHALRSVCDAIRLARSGLGDARRPVGAFLLVGPTGSGKTELAKALTEVLFVTRRR